MKKVYEFSSGQAVTMRKGFEWPGNAWVFNIEAYYHTDGVKQVGQIRLTREEASRLRRELGFLLRATAPPKKVKKVVDGE